MRRTRTSMVVLAATLLAGLLPMAVASADDLPESVTQLGTVGELKEHLPVTIQVVVTSDSLDIATDATIAVARVGGAGPDCDATPVSGNGVECVFPSLAAGIYTYVATYSGNASTAGSVSEGSTFEVLPDTLDASSVGRNYSTFYPVRDGYRDKVRISGQRDEAIAAAIRIYAPGGKRVKSVSIPSGSGAYHYDWNGRTAAGALRPAGRYRIVQTLTDAFGTKKSFTSYVTLSKKKLIVRTVYLTKRGSSAAARGSVGAGSVRFSTSGGWARLHGKGVFDSAIVGYAFTLPKAKIYKSISFQAYTNSPLSVPSNALGMQDFKACSYDTGAWDGNCFGKWQTIDAGAGHRHWSRSTSSSSRYRSGRHVRGAISVFSGTVYVYKVRVKVTYAVLR